MNGKIENFLKEYNTFKRYAEEHKIAGNETEITQLFAIFRKDERSNTILESKNGFNWDKTMSNAEQLATEKQKAYIKNIYESNGVEYSEDDIQKLTKKQASETIESFTRKV